MLLAWQKGTNSSLQGWEFCLYSLLSPHQEKAPISFLRQTPGKGGERERDFKKPLLFLNTPWKSNAGSLLIYNCSFLFSGFEINDGAATDFDGLIVILQEEKWRGIISKTKTILPLSIAPTRCFPQPTPPCPMSTCDLWIYCERECEQFLCSINWIFLFYFGQNRFLKWANVYITLFSLPNAQSWKLRPAFRRRSHRPSPQILLNTSSTWSRIMVKTTRYAHL